jgi:hypothetical protein
MSGRFSAQRLVSQVPRRSRFQDAPENEAAMRCSYIYFMKDNPDRVAAVAPQHAAYWRGLELREYVGGPFADRSGGLISL